MAMAIRGPPQPRCAAGNEVVAEPVCGEDIAADAPKAWAVRRSERAGALSVFAGEARRRVRFRKVSCREYSRLQVISEHFGQISMLMDDVSTPNSFRLRR